MPYNKGIFINNIIKAIAIIFVDNIILAAPKLLDINNIANNFSKEIKIQSLGEVKDFLGMHININKDKKSIKIS